MIDLIVVGGGVAGLMAAGMVASDGARVVLLEKKEKPARKLRITGKGRCNVTNIRPPEEFLAKIPQGAEFFSNALQKFDNNQTITFFEKIGVPMTVERGGRVFPTSGKAWDVADSMVAWAKRNGAEIHCNTKVLNVTKTDNGFSVSIEGSQKMLCKNLLIATGGVSYPTTGSTGDGYGFAHEMGHEIVPIRPSLVPLDIAENIAQFNGLELKNVGLNLMVDGKIVNEKFGDIEFTDKALGGSIILQISRMAVDAIIDRKNVEVLLDLKPALTDEKLRNRIKREIEAMPTANFKVLLQKLTPWPLFPKIARQSSLKLTQPIQTLTDAQISELSTTLKSLRFKIINYRPFTEAIITAGGVQLSQIDPQTMQSRIISGLYFAGEVLDIDADTGGFNIQIALSTAFTAAKAITSLQ